MLAEAALGAAGVALLQSVKDALDPAGVLNPGVLLPARPEALAQERGPTDTASRCTDGGPP